MNDKPSKSKTLALFDFDGTITNKDSMTDFIRFAVGKRRYYSGLITLSPMLTTYLLKRVSNQHAKEMFLAHFFGGRSLSDLKRLGQFYSERHLHKIVRPKALETLRWHKKESHRVIVVSASVDIWLNDFCLQERVELICTTFATVRDGNGGHQKHNRQDIITGSFDGKNCHGREKVDRIRSLLNIEDFDEIYAYGDSSGDNAMLALANKRYYRTFR